MATGTSGGLLDTEATQSFVKHEILRRYAPEFTYKLGLSGPRLPVTLVDGYAGQGRYPDGKPASAELLLQVVTEQKITGRVELVEKNARLFPDLSAVVEEYRAKAPGASLKAHLGEIETLWDEIVARSANTHLFLFLDPCGAGVGFDALVRLVNEQRPSRPGGPRTEVLLNFSADLIRRMCGAALKDDTREYGALDAVCGGSWWKNTARDAREEDSSSWFLPLRDVVQDYSDWLRSRTNYAVSAIPVRADVGQQPKFYLVHMTASGHGVWAFSDAVAKAIRDWFHTVEERRKPSQGALFDVAGEVRDELFGVEARELVRTNLHYMLRQAETVGPLVRVSERLLGQAVGAITAKEVGEVVRKMEKDGELSIIQKGKRGAADYVVQAVRR